MMRVFGGVVVVVYVAAGMFATLGLPDHNQNARIVGYLDLLAAAVTVFALVKRPQGLTPMVLTSATCFGAYVWSTLDWPAGHDAAGLAWLYVGGPLHVLPLIIVTMTVVARVLMRLGKN
jgi:hypothetical protein